MSQQVPWQRTQASEKPTVNVLVLAVALIVIIFLAGLMIVIVAGPSNNDLRADLDSTVLGEGGFVFVSVYGEITNTGDQPASGVVTIKVWDGAGWQSFTETTGLIDPQGSTEFAWVHFFESSDSSEFEVEWSVAET